MVLDELDQYPSYVIYGAQVVAVGAYAAIRHLTGRIPEWFVVGSMEGNPKELDGIPVRPIGAYRDLAGVMQEAVPMETFVLVAVTELIQKEVLPCLEEKGYCHVFPLTQHEEHLLMSEYYRSIGMFPLV